MNILRKPELLESVITTEYPEQLTEYAEHVTEYADHLWSTARTRKRKLIRKNGKAHVDYLVLFV